jgi:hypothetical protein
VVLTVRVDQEREELMLKRQIGEREDDSVVIGRIATSYEVAYEKQIRCVSKINGNQAVSERAGFEDGEPSCTQCCWIIVRVSPAL